MCVCVCVCVVVVSLAGRRGEAGWCGGEQRGEGRLESFALNVLRVDKGEMITKEACTLKIT